MVTDFNMYTGVKHTVFFQNGQKQAVQCDLTGGYIDRARLHISTFGQFGFTGFNVLKSNTDMAVKPLPLGSQLHSAVASEKQRTPKLTLKVLYRTCEIRLII